MTQITVACPTGHRLRGDSELLGQTIRCPKCAARFVFAAPETRSVTDTGVMRILGEMEAPPSPPEKTERTNRPCPTCGKPVSRIATVCASCRHYVGPMPMFLQQLQTRRTGEHA